MPVTPTRPKVSVVVISYNQEEFLRTTLESFFLQKTEFDIEIIIADDGSTDNTQSIIIEYATRYPLQLKPILRKKNIGVQRNLIDALQKAEGDYIALCEGDDFWTDPDKLQQQVHFLDRNPEYALCFHPVRVFFENQEYEEYNFPEETDVRKFTLKELLKANFIQTNSVMYRRQTYQSIPDNILPLDWYLHLYHAKFGKIGFMNKTMSAYRKHNAGIWWAAQNKHDEFWLRHGISHLRFYEEIYKLYSHNKNYHQIIYEGASYIYDGIFQLAVTETSRKVIDESVKNYPSLAAGAYLSYKHRLQRSQSVTIKQEQTIKNLNQDVKNLQEDIKIKNWDILYLKDQLKTVYDSVIWRLAQKIIKYKNIIFKNNTN